MYIPEYWCGVIVGGLAVFFGLLIYGIIKNKKKK